MAFEFIAKLGVPSFCFHDRDLAPEGTTFAESCDRLDEMAESATEHMERRVRLLWGTANLFTDPRYAAGAVTNPDPAVFAHAAAQVCHCLEVTHRLGGANYVLWGGRESYETSLSTDMAGRARGGELEVLAAQGRPFTKAAPHAPDRRSLEGSLPETDPFLPTNRL